MEIDVEQDIVSVTDLKRQTKHVIDHVHSSKRPVVVTVNGRADVVLMSAKTYEKLKRSTEAAQSLRQTRHTVPTEAMFIQEQVTDPLSNQTFRKFKDFWQEFKYVHKANT